MTTARLLAASTLVAAAVAAGAQYAQPYNPNDPQNYSAPASQQYQQQNPYSTQQQAGYPAQNAYDQNAYDQNAYNGQQAIEQAPPPLPEYDQPEAPGDGYLWTPGYWAFGNGGYYWVAGAWVEAPYQGALWTPGYWGQSDGGYFWNVGYWGQSIGYYGGINYGFGYFGTGFYGGYWNGGHFFYNREYARGRFGFGYREPWRGGGGFRSGGRSFTTVDLHGNAFRGGSYNQRGLDRERENFDRGHQNDSNRGGFGGRENQANRQPDNAFGRGGQQPASGDSRQRGFSTPQQQSFNTGRYNVPQQQGYQQQGRQQQGYQQHSYQAPQQQMNQQRGFSAPQQQQLRSSAPQQQPTFQQHSFSAPQQRVAPSAPAQNGGGQSRSAPSGGGFNGGSRGGHH